MFGSDPACDERHFALPMAHNSRTCTFITIVNCPFTHMFHVNCCAAAELLFSPTSSKRAAKNLAQSWLPFRRANIIFQATSVRRPAARYFSKKELGRNATTCSCLGALQKNVVHPPLLWTIFQTSINRGVSRPAAGAKRSCRFSNQRCSRPTCRSWQSHLFSADHSHVLDRRCEVRLHVRAKISARKPGTQQRCNSFCLPSTTARFSPSRWHSTSVLVSSTFGYSSTCVSFS